MHFDRTGFEKEVGVLLQKARVQRRKTQENLAAQIGIPRATYANIEGGRQRVPLDIVWRAAIALGCSIQNLVPQPDVQKSEGSTTPTLHHIPLVTGYSGGVNFLVEENRFVQRGRNLGSTSEPILGSDENE